MALIDKIRKGSFRGVEFDTFSWNRERVKKNTEHQYANSNRRYIEERGVQEPDFDVTLSIFGGDDYINKRDALRKALETEGEGILVLPLEGEFNVKCTKCSDNQSIIDGLGRCDFSVNFKVISQNENSGNPVEVKNNKISLLNNTTELRENMANVVNNNMKITNAISYTNSLTKLNDFALKMNNIANQLGNGDLSDLIKNFTNNIPNFLGTNLSLLGSSISLIFETFETVSDIPSNLLSNAQSFFNFGSTDQTINGITKERIEQKTNQDLLNTQIKISSLGSASNAFADNDFSNEEDLKQAEDSINNVIEEILSSDTLNNNELEGIEDIKYYLKELQVDFNEVVKEKELTTPKIIEIEAKNESVALISYKYYNSLDYIDQIIELNNISDPKNVNGIIRILSE